LIRTTALTPQRLQHLNRLLLKMVCLAEDNRVQRKVICLYCHFQVDSEMPTDISHLARPYKRVKLPNFDVGLNDGMMDGSGNSGSGPLYRCVACDQHHPVGYCPLKLAGVEHCGLCGLAHFGYSRTCPHLNSEARVAIMLGALKESTEQRTLVEEATKYLRGIRGNLVRKKKLKAAKNATDIPQTPSLLQAANLAPKKVPLPTTASLSTDI
jgi:hypothetical protein